MFFREQFCLGIPSGILSIEDGIAPLIQINYAVVSFLG